MTTTQLRKKRERPQTEDEKREQSALAEKQAAYASKRERYEAMRLDFCWALWKQGYTQEEMAIEVRREFQITVSARTCGRDVEKKRLTESYEAYAVREGHTRTKHAIAHGHDVRDAQDTTLAGDPRIGLKGALDRLKHDLCKKH